jgi:hypothetical protein
MTPTLRTEFLKTLGTDQIWVTPTAIRFRQYYFFHLLYLESKDCNTESYYLACCFSMGVKLCSCVAHTVFENRVLRRESGHKVKGDTEGYRKDCNQELHELYSSSKRDSVIKRQEETGWEHNMHERQLHLRT